MSDGAARSVPSWSGEPLRSALRLLLVVAVVCAVGAVGIVADPHPELVWPMGLFAAMGLANIGLGVLAWSRRPHNRTGLLLCVAGFIGLLSIVGNSDVPVLYVPGFIAGQAIVAAILHVLLAFPSGRLGGRLARSLVVAMYLVSAGLDTVRISSSLAGFTGMDPQEPFDHWLLLAQHLLGAVILLIASLDLWGRRRVVRPGRPAGERAALLGVYAWGIGALWFIPVSANILQPLLHWSAVTLFVVQILLLVNMPVVFAGGLLRGGFAQTGRVEELGAALATARHGFPSLRDAVAAALGDPTASLVVPVPPSPPASGRGRVVVEGSAGPFAAVDYDAELNAELQPVAAVAEVVSLALQRDQLLSELVTSREQVIASRARLVEVADAERRRVVTDLHDVLQSRLVLAAIQAGTLAVRADPGELHELAEDVRLQLDAALDELRQLIHGVMPATLIDIGLFAAVEELLDRSPLPATLTLDAGDRTAPGAGSGPLPGAVVSSAYLIVAEAVTNAVKHSGATRLEVSVVREPGRLRLEVADDGCGGVRPHLPPGPGSGLGLRSLTDRAEALGGRAVVVSPAGEGTRISVELPCES